MDKTGVKMLINDIENKDELFGVIVNELRCHGIKYRKEKRSKAGQDKAARCRRIFNVPLHTLKLTDVILANGGIAQVPAFVSEACQRILEQIHTEGLFRKAGSSKRQQEIKANLESGVPLGKSHHVIDVANILKTFFRDLPEPLLPTGNIQEALIRCLMSGEHKVYNLMITCLLLPPITLNTLSFFMQFLHTVSLHSSSNKMSVENLAIILTPNIMPIAEMIQQRLASHVKVVQLLIENSHQIGVVPESILEKLNESEQPSLMVTTDKKKKKRRSGSLTRMFHGLRKIVGAIGSSESLDKTDELPERNRTMAVATPCLTKSTKRRKVTDGMPFSAKKIKDIVSSLPDTQEILPYTPISIMKETKKSRLSLGGNKNKAAKTTGAARLVPSTSVTSIVDNKPMERRWSVVGAPWARKKRAAADPSSSTSSDHLLDKSTESGRAHKDNCAAAASCVFVGLSPVVSLPNLSASEMEKENQLFDEHFTAAQNPLLKGKSLFNDTIEDDADDGEEFMRIPKSEYEAIKERVSAIENRISQEFGIVSINKSANIREPLDTIECVEDQYLQTLEQTVPIEASCSTTDQLAKRLSRELKIRRSADQKIMRSPSARKIGSIRRRSRENVRLSRNQSWHMGSATTNVNSVKPSVAKVIPDLSFYPKTNLKRGRPNTVQTGLKHPELSPVKISGETKRDLTSTTERNITDEEKREEKWTCAQNFFKSSDSTQKNDCIDDAINNDGEVFKTPEVIAAVSSRRASLRSASDSKKTPGDQHFVTRIKLGETKTPMLPPEIPPRRTPSAKTPMLPPKTPGRLESMALKSHLTPLQELQSGRASIARLRSQNAGMVMAKAKLFDGMVTGSNNKGGVAEQITVYRRQSTKFVQVANNSDGLERILKPSMDVSQKIQLRQVQKLRSASASQNQRSPRRSTPRKRALTKSPHGGGINRREKLRLAAKSPAAKKTSCHSPKVLASSNISVCFSPNLYDLDNRTPHAKRPTMRNSPRRLISNQSGTPPQHGRVNSSTINNRRHTPLKATPLSKLALAASQPTSMPNRGSPRLMANSGPRLSTVINLVARP